MEFSLTHSIEVLTASPATVKAMLDGLSNDWIASNSRDDWGPFDVVGHLIHAEQTTWIPRARVIVEQNGDRMFPPFDRAGHYESVKGKSLHDLLDEFEEDRAASLEVLRSWNLSEEHFGLTGLHPEFGEVTLGQLIATWTVHDLTHIRQITISMAKRYETAVGPWKEYLSILK